MTENQIGMPAILIDIKGRRIRIHKNTLYLLGKPNYILLMVNPDTKTIAITPSTRVETAHRVRWEYFGNRQSCELYSSSLVHSLHELCPEWLSTGKYRLNGEYIPAEKIVRFHMNGASEINERVAGYE